MAFRSPSHRWAGIGRIRHANIRQSDFFFRPTGRIFFRFKSVRARTQKGTVNFIVFVDNFLIFQIIFPRFPPSMNLLEVAKAAGVSPSTVSRALNRPESLTTEKLVAVREAITAMNYTPPPPERRRGPKMGSSNGSRKFPIMRVGLWCVGAAGKPGAELLFLAVGASPLRHGRIEDGAQAGLFLSGRGAVRTFWRERGRLNFARPAT